MKEEFKILNEIKKTNSSVGFKIPDNYFESLDDTILSVIQADETPFGKKIIMVLKPWISLAAIFILVALLYYSVPYLTTKDKSLAQALPNTEISLEFLSTRFDESELIDFIIQEDNATIFESIKTEQNLLDGISYEDIENLVIF